MDSIKGSDVFISYRHSDAREIVDRIYDHLRKELGDDRVFRDVEGIGHGELIRERVTVAIKACKIMLVVIGKDWASTNDANRPSRLFDPEDYVSYEVTTAMSTAFQIIPVTVHNAAMPDKSLMPMELGKALERLAIPVRSNPFFDDDMKVLAHRVKEALLDYADQRRVESAQRPQSFRIVGHSDFFFWWPVWVAGFMIGLLTWWQDNRLAVVPRDVAVAQRENESQVTLTTKGATTESLASAVNGARQGTAPFPNRIADSSLYGYTFALIVLVFIFFSTIRLKGHRYVVVTYVILFVIFGSLVGLSDTLQIRLTLSGYLFLSASLFVVWVFVVFCLDRHVFVVFTPREIVVGSGYEEKEQKYSIFNLTVEKRHDGDFRHWLLGSGDVTVKTAGHDGREFIFYNVLFINRKLKELQEMYKESPVKFSL